MNELYCGIDIHKESFSGCVMDVLGHVVREDSFPARKENLLGMFVV